MLRIARPEDAIKDTTVVYPKNATRLVGQHRLDGNPFIIGELIAHDSSPQFGKFESQASGDTQRLPAWPGLRRFLGKAEINQPPAESVEKDPKRPEQRWESLVIYFHGIIETLASQWRGARVFAVLRRPPPSNRTRLDKPVLSSAAWCFLHSRDLVHGRRSDWGTDLAAHHALVP